MAETTSNKKFLRMLHGPGAPWHGGPIRDGFVAEDVFDNSTCTCNLNLSPLAEKSPLAAGGKSAAGSLFL